MSNPFDDLLNDINQKKLNEMVFAFQQTAEMMMILKNAFIEAGFTEEQSMEFTLETYMHNLREATK
ncbi:hypothetical protein P4388_33930 [Bacillus thuringiensis]|uniref:Uncharacterized protein n=1 Tax=Bacillus thuringiensis TaxID=1428 RepID=A0A9X6VF85_BACTU|nr:MULTISPECIES: hypothetical protein [Bacillus cereus group]MCU5278229.1 hypothetical protein [Bacillus cereus]AMR85220.1 hypothetical protein A3L20_14725 [Bacillus thuringiensis]MBG9637688.1 hypothetical protein [Bacillus thuringiensis]MBG9637833.1 hypothetical protein [Bacillus thuringiensis]MBG9674913.1 hypothetical protein [Bacillus thuringiensis]